MHLFLPVECVICNLSVIREYGSTLYVMMTGKKMTAHTFQLQVMS